MKHRNPSQATLFPEDLPASVNKVTGELPGPALRYVKNIRAADITIYDPIEVGDPQLWIPTPDLNRILNQALHGKSLPRLASKTRSKLAKTLVCEALGYPAPPVFTQIKPRLPGQHIDVHVQERNNLQPWNKELTLTHRYVLIRPSPQARIDRIRVVTGEVLARFAKTGTLTYKYQALCKPGVKQTELVTSLDTERLRSITTPKAKLDQVDTPVSYPVLGELLPIAEIYTRLRRLINSSIQDAGSGKDRVRGGELHRQVCQALGYRIYQDNGQFPDVRHQLLEVKLQTSPTIDLGLVLPTGEDPLDVPKLGGAQVRHCDVRYAVFYGKTDGQKVTLTHLFVTTGAAFFDRFSQCGGNVKNQKLQIKLPADFFDRDTEGPQYELV